MSRIRFRSCYDLISVRDDADDEDCLEIPGDDVSWRDDFAALLIRWKEDLQTGAADCSCELFV